MSHISEKEIVTLGFGNYSTLVAAQWANSTSHYDVHHETLYSSRRAHRVLGGTAISRDGEGGMGAEDEGNSSKHLRVPRLVLLDAPTGTVLESLEEMMDKEEKRNHTLNHDDNEEGKNHNSHHHHEVWSSDQGEGQVAYSKELLASSLKGFSSSTSALSSETLQKRLKTWEKMLKKAPWDWRNTAGYVQESEEEDDEEEEEEEKGYGGEDGCATTSHTEPYYQQLSEDARTPYFQSHNRTNQKDDSDHYYHYDKNTSAIGKGGSSGKKEGYLNEDHEEDEEKLHDSSSSPSGWFKGGGRLHPHEQGRGGGEAKRKRERGQRKKKEVNPFAAAKKMLFPSSFDHFPLPWWHYISTGLANDAVWTLRPPQHADAASQVAASHSFGYGLSHLRDTGASATMEMEALGDSLRRQLEEANLLQGLQCFVDADSMFGGAAYNTLETLWDEAGSKIPVAVASIFQPLPPLLSAPSVFLGNQGGGVSRRNGGDAIWGNGEGGGVGPGFAAQRREEQVLNRLLATTMLSRHSSAVYIPIELGNFDKFFSSSSTEWIQDDRATAQLIAASLDTALFGARDGGDLASTHTAGSRSGSSSLEPSFFLQEWVRTIRPVPSLRLAAMMSAMPLILRRTLPSGELFELSQWLEDTPLLGPTSASVTKQLMSSPYEKVHRRRGGVGGDGNDSARILLGQFTPLSHSMDYSPLETQGRVLGHAVSFRGAGVLPSTLYPVREAMQRYAVPLRTSTYLPFISRTNLPISHTFPLSLLERGVKRKGARQGNALPPNEGGGGSPALRREWLNGVDCGAHVLSTYASAPMLKDISTEAEKVLLPRYHSPYSSMHQSLYEMEMDDWREVLEEGKQIFDDYNHASPEEDPEEDGNDLD